MKEKGESAMRRIASSISYMANYHLKKMENGHILMIAVQSFYSAIRMLEHGHLETLTPLVSLSQRSFGPGRLTFGFSMYLFSTKHSFQ